MTIQTDTTTDTVTRNAIVAVDLAARAARLDIDVTDISFRKYGVTIQVGYLNHAHRIAADLGFDTPTWSSHQDGAIAAVTRGFHEGVRVQVVGYVPVQKVADHMSESPEFRAFVAERTATAWA